MGSTLGSPQRACTEKLNKMKHETVIRGNKKISHKLVVSCLRPSMCTYIYESVNHV